MRGMNRRAAQYTDLDRMFGHNWTKPCSRCGGTMLRDGKHKHCLDCCQSAHRTKDAFYMSTRGIGYRLVRGFSLLNRDGD